MRPFLAGTLITLMFILVLRLPVRANNLDPTFGSGGVTIREFITSATTPRFGTASAIQADGKIVIAGVELSPATSQDFVTVSRFTPDGQPDVGFGTAGTVNISVGFFEDVADLKIQPDGKILVSGTASFGASVDFYVLRLTSNGTPDPGFDGDGLALFDFQSGGDEEGGVMALQADGKIVLAGDSDFSSSPFESSIVILRMLTNGTLDSTFHGDGRFHVSVNPLASAAAVGLQSNQKIVVCGFSKLLQEDKKFTCLRIHTNGNPDLSFGSGILLGMARISVGSGDDAIESMSILPDDSILVTGVATNSDSDIGITRLSADGLLDTTFGQNGIVVKSFTESSNEFGMDVAVQPDGRFVILSSFMGGPALLRFESDGSPDLDFGAEGVANERVHPDHSPITQNLELQTDGNFIVSGMTLGPGTPPPAHFFVSRFLPVSKNSIGVAPFDFDGDSKTDVSVFRPNAGSLAESVGPEGSSSQWWYLRSSDQGTRGLQFGDSDDIPVASDFTGDGKTDIAFWRPSTGEWFILRSEDDSFFAFPFGASGDIPAPGDFDGDGKADPAVYRPSSGTWFIVRSSDGGLTVVPFGVAADQPIVADYDGDGMDDVGVYRSPDNQFWLLRSSEGVKAFQFGAPGDRTTVGDWTGDGKADVAFFRPSTSEWYVIRSEDDSFFAFPWGANGDVPSPGDFDGDGRFDPAVWRPSDRTWYIFGSTNGFQAVLFGANGDVPLPSSVSVN